MGRLARLAWASLAVSTVCAVSSAQASAMLNVGIRTEPVHSGGVLEVYAGGDPVIRRLAVVVAPERSAPRWHRCGNDPLCPPTSPWPVRAPLRVVGWISFVRNRSPHWTSVQLPHLPAGHYKVFALPRTPLPSGARFILFVAGRDLAGGVVDASVQGTVLRVIP